VPLVLVYKGSANWPSGRPRARAAARTPRARGAGSRAVPRAARPPSSPPTANPPRASDGQTVRRSDDQTLHAPRVAFPTESVRTTRTRTHRSRSPPGVGPRRGAHEVHAPAGQGVDRGGEAREEGLEGGAPGVAAGVVP
jgi:hypothetical protein